MEEHCSIFWSILAARIVDNKSESQLQRASLRWSGFKGTYLPVLRTNKESKIFLIGTLSREHRVLFLCFPREALSFDRMSKIFTTTNAIQISFIRGDFSAWVSERIYVSLSTQISLNFLHNSTSWEISTKLSYMKVSWTMLHLFNISF